MALRAVPDHPKFAELRAQLRLPKGAVLGWLESVWHFTGRFTPHGNIGKYSDAAIESWVEWNGAAGALVAAMVQTGWLERSAQFRLLVHDWHVHADNATKLSVKRSGLPFCITYEVHAVDVTPARELESATQRRLPVPEPEAKALSLMIPVSLSSTAHPDACEEIYKAYPRKVGKKAAVKAIRAAVDHLRSRGRAERDAQTYLYKATVEFAQSPAGNNEEFTPHPATWFNKGRYDDDRGEWQRHSGLKRNQRSGDLQAVRYVDPQTVHDGPEYDDDAHVKGAV